MIKLTVFSINYYQLCAMPEHSKKKIHSFLYLYWHKKGQNNLRFFNFNNLLAVPINSDPTCHQKKNLKYFQFSTVKK